MKTDPLYQQLEKRLSEVTVVSPQTVGPFTTIYKTITAWVKTWPLKVLVPLAFLLGMLFQLMFGERLIRIASVLQYGF